MPDTQRTIRVRNEHPLEKIVGKKLDEFTVQIYTEVYKTDVEGRNKVGIVGYFNDESIAKSYIQTLPDPAYYQTRAVHLLTDGKVGFLVGEEVMIMDTAKTTLEIRKAALAKLTPGERKILGI